jgi:hypothetical protein
MATQQLKKLFEWLENKKKPRYAKLVTVADCLSTWNMSGCSSSSLEQTAHLGNRNTIPVFLISRPASAKCFLAAASVKLSLFPQFWQNVFTLSGSPHVLQIRTSSPDELSEPEQTEQN